MKVLFTSKLISPGARTGCGCFGGISLIAAILEVLNLINPEFPFKKMELILILMIVAFTAVAIISWREGNAVLTVKENPPGGILIEVSGNGKRQFVLRDVKSFSAVYTMETHGKIQKPCLWIFLFDRKRKLLIGFFQGFGAFSRIPDGFLPAHALKKKPDTRYTISGINDLLMVCAQHLERV